MASPEKLLSGLDPYLGPWGDAQATHLLRRTGFGAKKAHIDQLSAMTMTQAVNYILTVPGSQPSPPVNNYNASANDPNVPLGQTWVTQSIVTNGFDPIINNYRLESLRAWWVGLMLNDGPHIREKMTLFWHNHFATEANVVAVAQALYNHYAMLRSNCLGNFKNLTKLVTLDATMLRYLNGYLNSSAAPDENYSRELQELFTVGKGPDSLYTEDDVKMAAKVLTGYRINYIDLSYYFDANQHDTTNKTFSSFYNNTTINGQSGQNGQQELNALLNMIFATEECAKHVCRNLYRFFVYYKIDANIEANVITPLAEIFRNSGYEILPTMDALLKSQHFYDTMSLGCVIRNPLDYVIGSCREFNVSIPNSSQLASQYLHWSILFYQSSTMQLTPGDPPNVAGWPAYNQQPMYHEIWIDSDTIAKRISFADAVFSSGINSGSASIKFDALAFATAMPNPGDPNALVADSVKYLYGITIGPNGSNYLKSFLLSGQSQDYYWSDAWNAYIQDPSDQTNLNIVQTRLKAFYKYMLQQAEYHLS